MKKHLAMVTLLLGALALLPALAQQQDATGLNSLQSDTAKFHRQAARAIPNHYIVVLDEDVSAPGQVRMWNRTSSPSPGGPMT